VTLNPATPAVIVGLDQGDTALRKFEEIFASCRSRIEFSWRASVVLSVVAFSFIVIMIAIAVWSAFVIGQHRLAAISGGLGVLTLIGTLIWRPLDRVFHATLLAQQIEIIHVRAMAGWQATQQIKERLKLMDEAIAAIRVAQIDNPGRIQERRVTRSRRAE
jgi:hypothetical protein